MMAEIWRLAAAAGGSTSDSVSLANRERESPLTLTELYATATGKAVLDLISRP